jgi:lysophospholipase L1-like esterase
LKILALLCLLASPAFSAPVPVPAPVSAPASAALIHDGDRIVFFGDSITEFENYTAPLEAWLTLRHPQWKLTFFNAGWAGDNTEGGLYRLDRDVLALKPTLVLMCFGMNDAYYMKPEAWVGDLFGSHLKDIVAKIRAAGARVALLTPGIVDEEGEKNAWLKDVSYNTGGLAMMVDQVKAFSAKEKVPYYDLHALMTQVMAAARAKDPKFNMLPDAIHPDEGGGLIMAYAFLQALGEDKVDAAVDLDLKQGQATGRGGLSLEKLAKAPDGSYSASLQFQSLPFFVEPKARVILPFLPWQDDYNRYTLVLKGVEGPTALELGGEPTAFLTPAELAQGLRLDQYWESSTLQQAMLVGEFAHEKQKSYIQLWRNLALRPNYNLYEKYRPLPHQLGIDNNEKLQGMLHDMAQPAAEGVPLRIVPLPTAGESLGNGEWARTYDFSPVLKMDESGSVNVKATTAAALTGTAGFWSHRRINIEDPDNNLGFLMDPAGKAAVYAALRLNSPVSQKALLRMGKDDSVEAWLNGKPVYKSKKGGSLKADSDEASVSLQRGDNLLLFRVGQGGGSWGFVARFSGLKQALRSWPASLQPPLGAKP